MTNGQTAYAKVEPLKVPAVREFHLDNGLTVLVFEAHEVPYAAYHFLVKTGALQDPEGKEGLAQMMATLLTYGTATRTEEQISQRIDALGASLSANASKTGMQVSGDIPTLDPAAVAEFRGIFAEVIRQPTFPEDAVRKVRTRLIGALRNVRDRNAALADRALMQLLYAGHPYGRPTSGHPDTLRAISRDDIVAFHRRYFVPEQAILGVAGDVDPAEVVAWARKAFGDVAWGANCPADRPDCAKRICRKGPLPSTCDAFCLGDDCATNVRLHLPPAPALPEGLRVVIVNKDDPSLNQVQWRLAHPGIVRYTDDDWYAWRLGTQILGGDFTARLNQVLRVREGLTYGARLAVSHDRFLPGPVFVTTYVKPKDLQRAVTLALAELERARAEAPSGEELASFKSKLIESLPFKFETAQHILSQHIELRMEDLDVDFLRQFPVRIDACDAAAVHAALERGLRTDALLLVAVGNESDAAALRPIVEKRGGKVEVVSPDVFFRDSERTPR